MTVRLRITRMVAGLCLAAPLLMLPRLVFGHDTWVQTNIHLIRVGDLVHIDLMLGNHGNAHRDFKLASKVDPVRSTLTVIAPDGKRYDLKDRLTDTGYAPKEGYWTTSLAVDRSGLYTVAHTFDAVMDYAPERSIKSAKAFFVASQSLDKPRTENPGFDRPLGHPLELVPVANPVTPMGPGTPISVRLLYRGKPLADERIAFIPRGVSLKAEGPDDRFEKITDANGIATFEPKEANYYLIVAHREEKNEGGSLDGKPYRFTRYGATLTVYVPQVCACCGG
ncbi:MAG: DUF4198 domain-containing protein [Capsulimonadales bacterium]|nr:DUF4198 domain-containing protein [Capsulimonadales bacterium]